MPKTDKDVISNKSTILTTNEIYKNIYLNQFLEIAKLASAFIVYQLVIRILDNAILDHFKNKKILYIIILIVFLICITLIAVKLFTYMKINSEKDDFVKQIIK
jgi:hypothetical protein